MSALCRVSSWMEDLWLPLYWWGAAAASTWVCVGLPMPSSLRDFILLAAARGKTWPDAAHLPLPRWLKGLHVPQAWFQHFYCVATLWNLAWSAGVVQASPGGAASVGPQLLVLGLLQSHFVRRMLESSFLSVYSPASRMHITGYLVGISYYLAVPPSLVPVSPLVCPSEAANPLASRLPSTVGPMQISGLALYVLGTWRQHESHRILARIRQRPPAGSSATDCANAHYRIPEGGWFRYVSCPHYLAEIVIYAGLVLIRGLTVQSSLLLVWVISNLVVSARANHEWYRDHFQHYPRGRRAIIPGVL